MTTEANAQQNQGQQQTASQANEQPTMTPDKISNLVNAAVRTQLDGAVKSALAPLAEKLAALEKGFQKEAPKQADQAQGKTQEQLEIEKLRRDFAASEEARAKEQAERRKERIKAELMGAAQGFVIPDAISNFVRLTADEVKIGEDGTLSVQHDGAALGLKDYVKAVLKQPSFAPFAIPAAPVKPAAKTPGFAFISGGGQLPDVTKMHPEEFAARAFKTQ